MKKIAIILTFSVLSEFSLGIPIGYTTCIHTLPSLIAIDIVIMDNNFFSLSGGLLGPHDYTIIWLDE